MIHRETLTVKEIAELFGYGPSAVSNWRSRHDDFPEPVETESNREVAFDRAQVEAWLRRHKKQPRQARAAQPLDDLVERMNALLATEDSRQALVNLASVWATPNDPHDSFRKQLEHLHKELQADGLQTESWWRSVPDPNLAAAGRLVGEAGQQVGWTHLIDSVMRGGPKDFGPERGVPRAIANLMVGMIEPMEGVILDPAVGRGELLRAAVQGRELRLLGCDPVSKDLALADQWLRAVGRDPELTVADALLNDPFAGVHADRVLIAPPWGRRVSPTEVAPELSRYVSANSAADMLWLIYAQSHLSAGGRAVVALPTSSLSHRGSAARIGHDLIREGFVESIVTLPRTEWLSAGFRSHSTVALWVLHRSKRIARQAVLLVDAAARHERSARDIVRQPTPLLKLLDQYRDGRLDQPGGVPAAIVSSLDLLNPDTALLPAYWVERTRITDVDTALRAASASLQTMKPIETRSVTRDLDRYGAAHRPAEISLGTLQDQGRLTIHRGSVRLASTVSDSPSVPVLDRTSFHEGRLMPSARFVPSQGMHITRPGEVIYCAESNRPWTAVDSEGGYALGPGLTSLLLTDPELPLTPQVLAALLKTRRVTAGAQIDAPSKVSIRDILIPLLQPAVVASLDSSLNGLLEATRRLRASLQAVEAAESTLIDATWVGLGFREPDAPDRHDNPQRPPRPHTRTER